MDNYKLKNNTYSKTPKDNPKDRIDVEIGDIKQADFYPQVKHQRRKRPDMVGNNFRVGLISPMKGKKHTAESKEKMRQSHLGKVIPEEQRRRHSELLKGRIPKNLHTLDNSGVKSHWWKGGVTKPNELARKGKEFRHWRTAVFKRDDYTCQRCDAKNKKGEKIYLHPHHIQNFSDCIELRFVVSNGITFCEKCHRKFHKVYGSKDNNKQQIEEFLCQI